MADGGTGAIGGSETERIGSPSELQWLAYIKAFAYPATNADEDDHECLISGRKRSVSFRCEIIRHPLLPIQLELLQASRTSCVAPLPNLLSLCRRAQPSQCGLGRVVLVEAPRAVAGRDPVKAQSFFPALLQSIEFGGIEIGLTNLSGFRRPDHRLPSMYWRVSLSSNVRITGAGHFVISSLPVASCKRPEEPSHSRHRRTASIQPSRTRGELRGDQQAAQRPFRPVRLGDLKPEYCKRGIALVRDIHPAFVIPGRGVIRKMQEYLSSPYPGYGLETSRYAELLKRSAA
ncbi:hypothetical protein LB523_19050 [Mesorhizobium sp. ESP-6-4]|uniref:hypothetical protein n=1 Tax=Mesorhizobium sp. ESP-6-4 TaxID=2876624 RepID=UPI001CCA4C7C|nr:hypothetical protein [Mesorhizobium sp. ESP-6-4]MBZ9661146.1 hypothetical protein [Mesorhizobium sp. ESP-6-4]